MKFILIIVSLIQRGWNKADMYDEAPKDDNSSAWLGILLFIGILIYFANEERNKKK